MANFEAVNEGRRYVYDLLSRLYEREVDEELLRELTSAAERGELARRFEALAELDERVGRGLDLMLGYLRSAAGRARKDVVLKLAAEYASLFLGVKGDAAPPIGVRVHVGRPPDVPGAEG
jgi:TorA-specific chaperone